MKIPVGEGVRLDKWLWAARFFKNRTLARKMIECGKVRYNGQRVRASKIVALQAEITLQHNTPCVTVIVTAIDKQRRSHAHAISLYQETEASIVRRRQHTLSDTTSAGVTHAGKRPDKKTRRHLIQHKRAVLQ